MVCLHLIAIWSSVSLGSYNCRRMLICCRSEETDRKPGRGTSFDASGEREECMYTSLRSQGHVLTETERSCCEVQRKGELAVPGPSVDKGLTRADRQDQGKCEDEEGG